MPNTNYTPNSPVAPNSVLGNSGSALGGVEEIPLGTGLAFDADGKLTLQNTGTITIEAADLLNLNSGPFPVIIPAQGVGTVIFVDKAVWLFDAGTTFYDITTNTCLFYDNGQSFVVGHQAIVGDGIDLTANVDYVASANGQIPVFPVTDLENLDIILGDRNGDNTPGEGIAGDGILKLLVYYRVFSL